MDSFLMGSRTADLNSDTHHICGQGLPMLDLGPDHVNCNLKNCQPKFGRGKFAEIKEIKEISRKS